MHESSSNVDLPDRTPSPGYDFGGEHRAHSDFLTDGQQHGVHAGGIGAGKLGDVADPHQLPSTGIAAPHFGVALERSHEAKADRLDDRIDEIGNTPGFELLDARVQRFQAFSEIRDDNDLSRG